MCPSRESVLRSGVLCVLLVGLGMLPAAASPPIQWDPPEAACTIGTGDGPTEDAILTITSEILLTDVDLRVVPELEEFVEVMPDHFDEVAPGMTYEVNLRFSVAPSAPPGQYDGTVQAWSRHRVVARPLPVVVNVDYGDIVIPPTTKVLSRAASDVLTSIAPTPQGQVLSFSGVTDDMAELSPGDVLVVNVCDAAPMGFLGRVTDVEVFRDAALVYTEPATIEDAISQGTIQVARDLGPDDVAGEGLGESEGGLREPGMLTFYVDDLVLYDHDGDPGTSYDQLRADGSVGVGVGFDFTLGIDWEGIHYLRCAVDAREQVEVEFSVDIPIVELEKEVTIATTYFTPIVVWAGFVPVVIVPELRAYAEFEGSAAAGIETSVIQEASMSLGVLYDEGEWSPIAELSYDLDWVPPHFTLEAEVKGSVGPQLNMLLYGVVGPYVQAMGFVELDVEVIPPPLSWELYGGIEAGVGARVDILGHTLADWEYPTAIGLRILLAHSEENPGYVAGQVTDAVTHQPLAEVSVDILDPLGNPVTSGQTDSSGEFSISVAAGSYRVNFSKPGYLPVFYFGVNVDQGETVYLEPVLQIDDDYAGPGSVSGHIHNALSGAGVPGIAVDLREGMNSTEGPIVASTVSGSGGAYSVSDLEAGNYTAEISAVGYLTSYFSILCIGGQQTPNQDATITPILPSGQTRIVLTWGATPSDLDSHTTGPLPDGTRFHMYYPYAETNWGSPWPEYVTLDLDDVTSYGPETTTLLQQIPGVYRFLVHDYTNRSSTYSTALSSSGALVRVYSDEGLVASFPVPTGHDGTLWTVFELDAGTITPINTFSYESSPSQIRPETPEDSFDWFALPSKGAVEGGVDEAVASLSLIQPNPFAGETSIAYTVPSAGAAVAIGIYDAAGRLVVTVADEPQPAGRHVVAWDGRDSAGRSVSSGIYFCRATIGEWSGTRKIVLLK